MAIGVGIGIGDVIAVYGLIKQYLTWKEIEPLKVDSKWFEIAKEKGVIDSDRVYGWADKEKAGTRVFAGTHDYVWLIDKKKRTRQKIEHGNSILIVRANR